MQISNIPNRRLDNLLKTTDDYSLDALLITHPTNVSYICKYNICDSYLLVSHKKNFLITDFRYLEEAQSNIKNFPIKQINDFLSFTDVIASIANDLKIKRLGFEAKHLPFAEYKALTECLDSKIELVPSFAVVENLRITKEKEEIHKIEAAVKLTVEAFIFAKDIIKPGICESDISAEINRFIRYKGASSSSFDIIVASGSRSSMPHSKTSSKIINDNEPVLVDMGVDFSGYKSDLTHMFFLGKMPTKVTKAKEVIFAAKNKAINMLKPGLSIKEIDCAAREYIATFGWSENFGHAIGHGIGLDVHEDPHINRKNSSHLKAGMVFTIEPAVYFPGRFGIRLEDMVLITEKGFRVLNASLHKSM